MEFEIILAGFIMMLVIIMLMIYIIYYTHKFKKGSNDTYQKSNFISHLEEKIAERVNYITFNALTNSNILSLQEPYPISNNSKIDYGDFLKENSKVINLRSCHYCGSLIEERANDCLYCRIELKN